VLSTRERQFPQSPETEAGLGNAMAVMAVVKSDRLRVRMAEKRILRRVDGVMMGGCGGCLISEGGDYEDHGGERVRGNRVGNRSCLYIQALSISQPKYPQKEPLSLCLSVCICFNLKFIVMLTLSYINYQCA
jgi:hypothetical protein